MPKHIIIANSIRVVLLFLCVSSYCQTPKSGIAEYKVKISTKFLEGLSRQSPIYGEITEAARYMNQLQYNLYFNSEIALYKFQEQLLDEKNRSIENASKIARKTPVYTLQASGEVFNKIEFMGDDYLIIHNCSGYEW